MATRNRRNGRSVAAAACAAALAGACAMDAPAPRAQAAVGGERQCFLASRANGFSAVDRDTVLVEVGARTLYELQLFATCPDINWEHRIGIRSTGGSSWVCSGYDAELLVSSPVGLQRCQVTDVRRLSPEEAQAARARRR